MKKLNQYQIIEELGSKKFHGTYLAEDPNHQYFVIKKNAPLHGRADMEAIHREIGVLKKLRHPHLALFIEVKWIDILIGM